jgi:hypothetical protein
MYRYFLLVMFYLFFCSSSASAGITNFFNDLYTMVGVFNAGYPDNNIDTRLRIEQVPGTSYLIQRFYKQKNESWSQELLYNQASGSLSSADGTDVFNDYNYGSVYTGVNAEYNTSGGTVYMYVYEDIGCPNISPNAATDKYYPVGYMFFTSPCVGNYGISSYSNVAINLGTGNLVQWSTVEMMDLCLSWSTPTPTPTPLITPTPTPLVTLTPTPTPTPTPVLYPIPSVIVTQSVGEVDGNFTYDSTTGVGTLTVTVKNDVELVDLPEKVYEVGSSTVDSKIPLPGGGTTDDEQVAVEGYLTKSGEVFDAVKVGFFKSVIEGIIDLAMNHPFLAYFNNVTFTVVDPVCSFTVDLFGKTLEFGFCGLENELNILKLVIIGIAGVYSVFIVMRGD